MRPPEYDVVNEEGEVVTTAAVATGGATRREGHFSLIFPDAPVTLPPGAYTLVPRHERESPRTALRFSVEAPEEVHRDNPGVPHRLDLSSKP